MTLSRVVAVFFACLWCMKSDFYGGRGERWEGSVREVQNNLISKAFHSFYDLVLHNFLCVVTISRVVCIGL